MTRSRIAPPLLATFAALAMLFAACGDDDDSGTGGNQAAVEEAVSILDFRFEPNTLTVATRTTVKFTNEDAFAHTATADDVSFDTGDIEAGASASVTFDSTGAFPFFCAIHNYMRATVVVE